MIYMSDFKKRLAKRLEDPEFAKAWEETGKAEEVKVELQHVEHIELSYWYIKGFRWLVRNEIGSVTVYVNKPHRDKEVNYYPFGKDRGGYDSWIETKTPISLEEQRRRMNLNLGDYNFITWKDEPIFIEDLIK